MHKPGPRRSLRTGTHQKVVRLQVLIYVFHCSAFRHILGKPTLKTTTTIICLYHKICYPWKYTFSDLPKLLFPKCSKLFLMENHFCFFHSLNERQLEAAFSHSPTIYSKIEHLFFYICSLTDIDPSSNYIFIRVCCCCVCFQLILCSNRKKKKGKCRCCFI